MTVIVITDRFYLSQDAANFAKELSNGYLIGEVLSKYQLQDDFDQFSQNRWEFSHNYSWNSLVSIISENLSLILSTC